MKKKIAVVTTERHGEALRMSVGITLADDQISVFVLDKEVEENDKNNLNLETLDDLEIKIYTNMEGMPNMEFLPTVEIASKLVEFDHVLVY